MLNKLKVNLGKKKTHLNGFEKTRTRKEVDEEYTKEAIMLGHESRILAQLNAEVETQEKKIEKHLANLLRLNKEGMALPPEPPKTDTVETEAKALPQESV